MGIQDRDYMKRPPANRRKESDQRLEAFFSTLLKRYPRLPLVAGALLVALIVTGILVALLGN